MPYLFRIRSTVNSLRTLRSSRVGVILRDSLIALALFGLLAGLIGWHSAPVQVVPTGDVLANGTTASQLLRSGPNIPGTTAAINAVLSLPQLDSRGLLHPTNRGFTVAILASVFAAIIAFNLWFLRHLGSVYVSSRIRRSRGERD